MAIIVYKSTDASAPTLSGQAGRMIAVLDACLVNGYGSKPAAGWTKAFSGTNLAAYRMTTTSPATGMYLRVDDTGTTAARTLGYDTMTDINTGTNPFPNNAQLVGGGQLTKSSSADATTRPWCLIADNTNSRGFYLITEPDQTVFGAIGTTSGLTNLYFFGDINTRKTVDGYECLHMTQIATGSSSSATGGTIVGGGAFAATSGHYLARSYTGLAVSQTCCKARNYRCSITTTTLGASDALMFPNRVTNGLDLARVMVQESAVVMRGMMPGLYEPMGGTAIANYYDEIAGAGPFAGTNFIMVPAKNGSSGVGSALIQITGSWY